MRNHDKLRTIRRFLAVTKAFLMIVLLVLAILNKLKMI